MNLDWKVFALVFWTIFLAELGDKTQLATLLYASQGQRPKLAVFLGASAALVFASALGVLAGSAVAKTVDERTLSWIAGIGFIAVGLWTLLRG